MEIYGCFDQIFLTPQVKGCAIITYKQGIYELPHELPNELRLRILGNIRKLSKLHRMIAHAQSPCQNESFVNTTRTLLKNRNYTFSVVCSFTWKLELVSDILWIIVDGEE